MLNLLGFILAISCMGAIYIAFVSHLIKRDETKSEQTKQKTQYDSHTTSYKVG